MSSSDLLTGRKGVVLSYRRGKHKQQTNQVLLRFEGISTKEQASAIIARKVRWVSENGREFLGTILGPHGKSGAVRAKFNTNLPGQAIGTPVHIL